MAVKPQYRLLCASLFVLALACCSTGGKLARLKKTPPAAKISVADALTADTLRQADAHENDTLIIRNIDGHDMIVMKAVRDEDGQMVAGGMLNAARVTARFRNVAERHGKVDLCFQVIVPAAIQDSRWQLRYSPEMMILGDTVALDKVIITGREYRKRQLRGYQQYQRFLDRIISDSTKLIHMKDLEIFIRRNLPKLYAFRNDTTFVSDEQFDSVFGVTEREAIDHYTDRLACSMNNLRISRKERMYRKYVKAPIITQGIRLDTVMVDSNGDYVYNYVQTIHTRPRLKRVDIVVGGEIYEQDRLLCGIGASDILNFYISSLSAFADDSERYITKIIERKVLANASHFIAFASGKAEIAENLGDNRSELEAIKHKLQQLLLNEEFDLDSVTVTATASPEGMFKSNAILSQKRGKSVAIYFDRYMKHLLDSLKREEGVDINLDAGFLPSAAKAKPIRFTGRHISENWDRLDILIDEDPALGLSDKEEYRNLRQTENPDERENRMRGCKWYSYMRTELYPRLRTVAFDFHLHRKGMVKDTVHTTELDTVYMAGVQAIKDRDFERAVQILMPYGDYNTAVAYCALDRNTNAMAILEKCERTAQVNYMMALLYSRAGDETNAVRHYLMSCRQNPQYVHRGNLDPEISRLITGYDLNDQLSQYQNN